MIWIYAGSEPLSYAVTLSFYRHWWLSISSGRYASHAAYASSDIEGLHVESKPYNGDSPTPTKDFSSLAEILWTIASYVTKKHSRLISISNTASTPTSPIIIIKYDSVNSEPVVEIFKGPAIYELCICVYKTETGSQQLTRFTRFSDLTDVDQRL